jgi:hypothetical protein
MRLKKRSETVLIASTPWLGAMAERVSAVNSQNLVQPQGTAKIGDREYDIELNTSAEAIDELNDMP